MWSRTHHNHWSPSHMSLFRPALAVVLVAASVAGAQQVPKPPAQTVESRRGVGDTSIFAPLNLFPQPNVYRDADGRPGPRYWEQRADYDLHATLDTAQQECERDRDGALQEQFARHAHLRLVPDRAERVQAWLAQLTRLRRRQQIRVAQLQRRRRHRPLR